MILMQRLDYHVVLTLPLFDYIHSSQREKSRINRWNVYVLDYEPVFICPVIR